MKNVTKTASTGNLKASLKAKVSKLKESLHPHILIIARAGTGKTTTLVEGLKFLKGMPTDIVPSEQQKAIWECLALSPRDSKVGFTAFNNSIANELKAKVPPGVMAMTNHSLGVRSVNDNLGRFQLEVNRVTKLLSHISGINLYDMKKYGTLASATKKLIQDAKTNLVSHIDENVLEQLLSLNDFELTKEDEKLVYEFVPQIYEACKTPHVDKCIDFNDMIWLPCILDLPVEKFDILMVDESQDLNKCQQQLTLKAGKRLVYCGDPKQAIYAFAGADSQSMNNLQKHLEQTPNGVKILPLTVTRRCGSDIVKEANKIVADFEAHELNPQGKVGTMSIGEGKTNYTTEVKPGDLVVCRVNSLLIQQCFKFLKDKKPTRILGQNVIEGLVTLIKRLAGNNLYMSIVDFTLKLEEWYDAQVSKENSKALPSDSKLDRLQERYQCLLCFSEEASTVKEMIDLINQIFDDSERTNMITLSTIHKAKGLEANRVFFLKPKEAPCPHPMAKTISAKEQEMNLVYVAITRAKSELYYVT